MSRFTLIPLSLALAGCAPLQPDGCEKASAVNDCVYARRTGSNVQRQSNRLTRDATDKSFMSGHTIPPLRKLKNVKAK